MQPIPERAAQAIAWTRHTSSARLLRFEAHAFRIRVGNFVHPTVSRDEVVALKPTRERAPRMLKMLVIFRGWPTAPWRKRQRHEVVSAKAREAPSHAPRFKATACAAFPATAASDARDFPLAVVKRSSWIQADGSSHVPPPPPPPKIPTASTSLTRLPALGRSLQSRTRAQPADARSRTHARSSASALRGRRS